MLPIATHTVTIQRATPLDDDPTEATGTTTVAVGVPAVIGSPSGREANAGGQTAVVTDVAQLEAGTDVEHTDIVVDDVTGRRYSVQWVRQRVGFGLDHVKVGLLEVQDGDDG